jgi:hypothetical protein
MILAHTVAEPVIAMAELLEAMAVVAAARHND